MLFSDRADQYNVNTGNIGGKLKLIVRCGAEKGLCAKCRVYGTLGAVHL